MIELLGRVVCSKAGRDAGRKFVIVGVLDEFNVLIVDGDLRKIERPKKKKMKRLEFTDIVMQPISDKLCKGIRVTNSEISKQLSCLES